MALQTQGADVLKVAFASAFHDWNDVICIPEAFSRPGAQSPIHKGLQARRTSKPSQLALCMQTIDTATSADPTVAYQNFLTDIARIAA